MTSEEKKEIVYRPKFLAAEFSLRLYLSIIALVILFNLFFKFLVGLILVEEGDWVYLRYFFAMLVASSFAFRIYRIKSRKWNIFYTSTFLTFICCYIAYLFLY